MNAKLSTLLDGLVGREGGYANHPADRGGETMWGITIAVARAFGYSGPMSAMPRETARAIYETRYWRQPGFDQIEPIDALIAEELLDTGVNMGQATAGRFLQRALNVLNDGDERYPNLTVDGAVGAMTRYALKELIRTRGAIGRKVLLSMLNAQQSVRYIELAENKPSQEAFEFGWQRTRVSSL